MFPGPGAHIYRNEEGEVLGWDYPGADDPYDPDDYLDSGPDPDDEDYDNSDEPVYCGECGATHAGVCQPTESDDEGEQE